MNKDQIIKKFVEPRWKLFLGSIIGVFLYPFFVYFSFKFVSFIWEVVSGMPVEAPTIDFMSSYSEAEKNGYWSILISVIIVYVFLSVVVPRVIGAGFGQWLLGTRYVDEDGQKPKSVKILKKFFIGVGKFLLITLPGPVLGFTFGEAADPFSLAALFAGFMTVVFLSFKRNKSGRTLSYFQSGLVPINKKHSELFKEDLKEFYSQSVP